MVSDEWLFLHRVHRGMIDRPNCSSVINFAPTRTGRAGGGTPNGCGGRASELTEGATAARTGRPEADPSFRPDRREGRGGDPK